MSSCSDVFASRNRAVKMQVPVVSMALVLPSLPIMDVGSYTQILFGCHLRYPDECTYYNVLSNMVNMIRSHVCNMSVKPN